MFPKESKNFKRRDQREIIQSFLRLEKFFNWTFNLRSTIYFKEPDQFRSQIFWDRTEKFIETKVASSNNGRLNLFEDRKEDEYLSICQLQLKIINSLHRNTNKIKLDLSSPPRELIRTLYGKAEIRDSANLSESSVSKLMLLKRIKVMIQILSDTLSGISTKLLRDPVHYRALSRPDHTLIPVKVKTPCLCNQPRFDEQEVTYD